MCSVHQRMFSTSEGYHEYAGGYDEYIGAYSVHWRRDIMSTSGDIIIHVEELIDKIF